MPLVKRRSNIGQIFGQRCVNDSQTQQHAECSMALAALGRLQDVRALCIAWLCHQHYRSCSLVARICRVQCLYLELSSMAAYMNIFVSVMSMTWHQAPRINGSQPLQVSCFPASSRDCRRPPTLVPSRTRQRLPAHPRSLATPCTRREAASCGSSQAWRSSSLAAAAQQQQRQPCQSSRQS